MRTTCTLLFVLIGACGQDDSKSSDGGPDRSPLDASLPVSDASPLPPSACKIALECAEEIVDEPKRPCTLAIESGQGDVVYQGWAGVEKRGRSSQSFPKPQYAIELWADQNGEVEAPTNLLGMGSDADWVLNGAYIDRSLIRNTLLYDLFQSLGDNNRYTAETRYCTLTKNLSYQGIYLLTERVKRDDDRVFFPADDAANGGSFLIKQDDNNSGGFKDVETANGKWQFIYPHRNRVLPEQVSGVSSWLDRWNAIVTGADSTTDIFSLVDLDNAVDFVLLEEFAKNNDAFYLSMHVWKSPQNLLRFVPWDLDLSFGQPNYNESDSPEGWILYRPALIRAMVRHPAFRARIIERWQELRQGPFALSAISARIDSQLSIISREIDANFTQWPIEEVEFLNEDNLYPVASHAEEMQLVRSWIESRLTWMDEHIVLYGE